MTSIYLERRGRVITEEQRIAQAASGDREAFRHLALQYGPYLYQVVYGVLQSPKDAEDVTQEVLLKMHSALPQYQQQGFKTWITRIAVNKAIDFKRSRQRKREELTDDVEMLLDAPATVPTSAVEKHVLSREQREQVRSSIRQLPEAYRDVVVAFYIEEKSYQQIALEQKLALKTVESKLYRAKQYMRRTWKEEDH
ncbi:sigma-70 family RNA polymerase sigma factor [Paenibacillus sp. GD4]|uniref:RNA polymerase sigma factor n=1 Tax=Paenibacillus sp. GD4 TaxID=3068890 RepID=UPI002796DE75|nr:sigma-70 family RNA polymerase sigma factor [Paenibacillus sp. GD4]MDQ1911780.1 sigma-70 family RNA polymerase sigma factor [Paenibacillus sp. GD4]